MPRRRNSNTTDGRFTVVGDDVNKSYSSQGAASSCALTYASRLRRPGEVVVLDVLGVKVARAWKDKHGRTYLESIAVGAVA